MSNDLLLSPLGPLPSRWGIRYLRDLTLKIGSGATPKGGEAAYLPMRRNYALVRSQNVYDRWFDETGLAYITDDDARRLAGVELRKDDVLLNITGDGITFGRACLVGESVLPAVVNQHVTIIRPRKALLDPGYLLAFLTHPHIKPYMESFNAGGSRRAITKGHIESFILPLPPIKEQQAIAHILGTLDDKIELNRKMNETLEAMTRGAFKSWLVDFDQNNGEMPENWSLCALDEAASFLNGLALQKYPPEGDEYLPVIKIAQLRKGDTEGADKASKKIDPAYIVANGDILFSWSGSLVVTLWGGGRGALNQHLFKVTSDRFPKWFVYFWLHHHLPGFQAIAASKATTMGHIQRHHLSGSFVNVPPNHELERMNSIFEPLLDRAMSNSLESVALAALRNTLLPKLLSGEIRVHEAEKQLEAVL